MSWAEKLKQFNEDKKGGASTAANVMLKTFYKTLTQVVLVPKKTTTLYFPNITKNLRVKRMKRDPTYHDFTQR